jgi:cell division protein FtsN
MSSKSASKSSAKAAKSNSSRTIMGVVSAVVIVGAVAYLAYSMGWIGAGEETQASKAVMPREDQPPALGLLILARPAPKMLVKSRLAL